MTIQARPRDWLPFLLSGRPHQVIGGTDDPYLLRWYLIPRNPVLNVYLHKFLRSDDDRALHDHPWWFVSLILRGQYDEVTEAGVKRRRVGSIAFRPAEWRHRVALLQRTCRSCDGSGIGQGQVPDGRWLETDCGDCDGSGEATGLVPCWTLIITGRRVRTWGFWCREFRGHYGVATSRHADEHGAELPYAGDRFIPWNEFGDAGCGESA